MYTKSLLSTQIWKPISQQLQMIETNRFQILNQNILKRGSTCTRKIHAQSGLQKHSYYLNNNIFIHTF